MGTDISSVLRKAKITSEIDNDNAHFMIDNALDRILSTKPNKHYTIVGSGMANMLIRTSDGEYYRICFRAYEKDIIDRMLKTDRLIRANDYGIMVPIESNITEDHIYFKVQLLTEPTGSVSYDELHRLFTKVLQLGQHDLAWCDYHESNVKRLNGELKIIDFECWDPIDVNDIMDGALRKYGLGKDTNRLQQWAYDKSSILMVIDPMHLCSIFALIHGYTDPYRFMRLRLNHALFCRMHHLHQSCYNRAVYGFLMHRPFELL